jgi:hypothetical protein
MVPAVAEVIDMVDRLSACLTNDIEEPRLAGIDGLGTKVAIGIRDTPTSLASQELEEVAVRPAKRLLKRNARLIACSRFPLSISSCCLTAPPGTGDVRLAVFSPSAALLLTASNGGGVRAWKVSNGNAGPELQQTWAAAPCAEPEALVVSRDGSLTAAGCEDGRI